MFEVLVFTVVSAVVIWVLVWSFLKPKSVNARAPPVVKEGYLPILGNVLAYASDPFQFWCSSTEKYGQTFTFYLFNKKITVLSLEDVKQFPKVPEEIYNQNGGFEIIFNKELTFGSDVMDGYQHVTLLKARLNSSLNKFSPILEKSIDSNLNKEFSKATEKSAVVINDVNDLATRMLLDAILSVLFGEALSQNQELMSLCAYIPGQTDKVIRSAAVLPSFLVWYDSYCLKKANNRVAEIIAPEVEKRRAKYDFSSDPGEEHHKLFDDEPTDLLQEFLYYKDENNQPMKVDRIARHFGVVLFAALSTTASLLEKFFAKIASDRELQELLREEQRTVIREHGKGVGRQNLDAMHHLDACFRELLRLGTGLIMLVRRVQQDFELASGYVIQAGDMACVGGFGPHFNESVYPDPTKFDHTRFLNKNQTVSTDFFGFGSGRHACAGRFFALMVVRQMAATALRRFEVSYEKPFTPKMIYLAADTYYERKPIMFKRLENPLE